MKQINNFWFWFEEHQNQLKNYSRLRVEDQEKLLFWLCEFLSYYCAHLTPLLQEASAESAASLTFSADGDADYYEAAVALVGAAPPFADWVFQAFILPTANYSAIEDGQDRPFQFDDVEIKASAIQFKVTGYVPIEKEVALCFYHPNFTEECDPEKWLFYMYVITQYVFGEVFVYKHIGHVTMQTMPSNQKELLPLLYLESFIACGFE